MLVNGSDFVQVMYHRLFHNFFENPAGDLLRNAKTTVSEIAREVGCGDLKHFNRLFKRQYGMTPRQFRGMEEN